MEVKDKVRNFIKSNIIAFDEETLFSDDDNLFELGFVNSLFAKKLVMYVEQDFNVMVSDEELDISNFNSVSNIVRFIEKSKISSGLGSATSKRETLPED